MEFLIAFFLLVLGAVVSYFVFNVRIGKFEIEQTDADIKNMVVAQEIDDKDFLPVIEKIIQMEKETEVIVDSCYDGVDKLKNQFWDTFKQKYKGVFSTIKDAKVAYNKEKKVFVIFKNK